MKRRKESFRGEAGLIDALKSFGAYVMWLWDEWDREYDTQVSRWEDDGGA